MLAKLQRCVLRRLQDTYRNSTSVSKRATKAKGVHAVTVNDYPAKRDAETNRPLFEFLGMTVGVNAKHGSAREKRSVPS